MPKAKPDPSHHQRKLGELANSSVLKRLHKRVDGRYRYPARRFVEFIRTSGFSLRDPECGNAYLASLKKLQKSGVMKGRRFSAATYNTRLAVKKAMSMIILKESTFNTMLSNMRISSSVTVLENSSSPSRMIFKRTPATAGVRRICTSEGSTV